MATSSQGKHELLQPTLGRRSTIAVAPLLAVAMLLVNVPGQLNVRPEVSGDGGPYTPAFLSIGSFEHGWPWRYLNRGLGSLDRSDIAPWLLTEDVWDFRLGGLLGDILVAAAIVIVGTGLFRAWRQRRSNMLQLHIADLFAIITIIAVGLGWLMSQRSEYEQEQMALDLIGRPVEGRRALPHSSDRAVRNEGGPTWLRSLLQDRWPKWFDRAVEVYAYGDELIHITKLRNLKALHLKRASSRQLELLEQLSQLEALDMNFRTYFPEHGP